MFVAWCFLRRLRVLAKGQVVHGIIEYNRVHGMFSYLSSRDARENQIAERIGIVDLDQNTDLAESVVNTGKKSQAFFQANIKRLYLNHFVVFQYYKIHSFTTVPVNF